MPLPEFVNFNISRIITHEIYKRDEEKQIVPPRLNNELTTLNEQGLSILGVRIVEAIGKDSKSVEMDIVNRDTDSVYSHVDTIFTNESEEIFIEKSKEITKKLTRAQVAKNLPGGIIIIMDGTTGYDEVKFVLIIKAELQSGFRKSTNNNSIEFVNDLLLTPYQKMYKIGAFLKSAAEEIKSYIYDYNMSKADEQGLAAYFYNTFLGCEMLHTNKFYTSKFYNGTKEYINKHSGLTDEEKYDMNTHLYSYMKSDALTTISIASFSECYITEAENRDAYARYMRNEVFREEGFDRSITKDISDIQSKLRMRKMFFSGSIRISGPSEGFEDKVQIMNHEQNENGQVVSTSVRILGAIEGLD